MNGFSLFKEVWNGVWHSQTPTSEIATFLVDSGLGFAGCMVLLIAPVLAAFWAWHMWLEWVYITLPSRRFERRHNLAGLTEDKSVYDMSDEELDRYEAELDF